MALLLLVDDRAERRVVDKPRQAVLNVVHGPGFSGPHVDRDAAARLFGPIGTAGVEGEAVVEGDAARRKDRRDLLPCLTRRQRDFVALGIVILAVEIALAGEPPTM